jgi:hypothetical protein
MAVLNNENTLFATGANGDDAPVSKRSATKSDTSDKPDVSSVRGKIIK